MFVALTPLASWAVLVAIMALFVLCLPSAQRWLAHDSRERQERQGRPDTTTAAVHDAATVEAPMPDDQTTLDDVVFDTAAFIDEIQHYLHTHSQAQGQEQAAPRRIEVLYDQEQDLEWVALRRSTPTD